MKIITKNLQLEDELQELYLESKHWLTDVEFLEDEIRFLKKIINSYLIPDIKNGQLIEINDFKKELAQQDTNIPHLKSEITALLKFIGAIINETNRKISIDLIEQIAILETKMKTTFEAVKQVKKSLFRFIDEIMKTGCKAIE
ncbi:MAG: hypothetical protein JWQ66_4202 [Mucilaginibacter sp.]|nr:hypothetical protein [Mucilaginibacter sp.]